MGKNIQIKKTVYGKDDYGKVIDRSFSSFKKPVAEAVEKTVEQFFKDYEEFEGDNKDEENMAMLQAISNNL